MVHPSFCVGFTAPDLPEPHLTLQASFHPVNKAKGAMTRQIPSITTLFHTISRTPIKPHTEQVTCSPLQATAQYDARPFRPLSSSLGLHFPREFEQARRFGGLCIVRTIGRHEGGSVASLTREAKDANHRTEA